MKNYKWLYSYTNWFFNTPDQNIHEGEFAMEGDQFLVYDPQDATGHLAVKELDTAGLTEIQRAGQRAFDVFQDPDTGIKEKYDSDLATYGALAVKGAGPRTKIKLP